MTTDRDRMYREICRRPEDDTLRLAYADWLDEYGAAAGRRPCPLPYCRNGYWAHSGDVNTRPHRCHVCAADGTVSNAADADRAEFVRVQCALDAHPYCVNARTGDYDARDGVSPEWRKAIDLADRERAALAAHPEWGHAPCEACEGGGIIDQGCHCPTCYGTGDLLLHYQELPGGALRLRRRRRIDFSGGFPAAVQCVTAEVFRVGGAPTLWAEAVVRRLPVVKFVLDDRQPFSRPGSSHGRLADKPAYDWSSAHEPDWLMAEMKAAFPDNWAGTTKDQLWWMEFATRRQADDAMAVAAGRVVRRAVYRDPE